MRESRKYFDDMESLKFVMCFDPWVQDYQFFSYPWFVGNSYMKTDFTTSESITNKLVIDSYKKHLFYESHFNHELFDIFTVAWPRAFFNILDDYLYQWYKEFVERYNIRKVFKKVNKTVYTEQQILDAWNEILSPVQWNISRLEADDCKTLPEVAHHVAQALMWRQTHFITNVWWWTDD